MSELAASIADPPCEECYGRGWFTEETEESKASGDVWNYDYRERYCSCPAGDRCRERDGGSKATNGGDK